MTDKKFYIHSDNIEIKASSSKKSFRIAGYANTSTKDRTGDIVTPEAWTKGIENYRKNPVLLYQHDQQSTMGILAWIAILFEPFGIAALNEEEAANSTTKENSTTAFLNIFGDSIHD